MTWIRFDDADCFFGALITLSSDLCETVPWMLMHPRGD